MHLRSFVLATSLVTIFVLIWVISNHFDLNPWQELTHYIRQQQQFFHRELADTVRAVHDEGSVAAMGMVLVSFLYGAFHAAGPGHGKAVISTYLASSGTKVKQGITLAFAAAFIQGLGAILLVEVFVGIARWSKREAHGIVTTLESISFALISLLGLILALKAAHKWRKGRQLSKTSDPIHEHRHDSHSNNPCGTCGHSHAVSPDLLESANGWKERITIAFFIGIRPCSGSVLILFFAEYIGLRWAGIASVFAISIGTAITVSIIALITVNLRQFALRLQSRNGLEAHENIINVIAFLGGVFIAILGFSLFQLSTLPPHPLL